MMNGPAVFMTPNSLIMRRVTGLCQVFFVLVRLGHAPRMTGTAARMRI